MSNFTYGEFIVTRFQPVRDGAGVKGLEIGMVGVPSSGAATRLVCILEEQDAGWIRIASIVGRSLPSEWVKKSRTGEYWTDLTGLMRVTDAPAEGEVKLLVKRDALGNWTITEL
jgi:hypothetical protein